MVTKEEVIEKLKTVVDPHLGTDVYTIGLIQELEIEGSEVRITFIPTSPFCPLGIQLAQGIKDAVQSIPGVKAVVKIKGHIQEVEINKQLNES